MNTLKGIPTVAEFNAALNEAKNIVEQHGWEKEIAQVLIENGLAVEVEK